ncbi:uncharacterized protein ARMOST_02248 [Armillaria ostoyae]|uniref:Uncharacterized protein n=1 Tax=Armillaria ostoyae TaxID=47428 RepID=A0A284QR64_ARMOS|nr:uncharacterized protein ARMOST_02248 [Armillaria ostoyae]
MSYESGYKHSQIPYTTPQILVRNEVPRHLNEIQALILLFTTILQRLRYLVSESVHDLVPKPPRESQRSYPRNLARTASDKLYPSYSNDMGVERNVDDSSKRNLNLSRLQGHPTLRDHPIC